MDKLAFNKETYIKRRQVLIERMSSGRIFILGNNESSVNFKDNHYHFRQDSTFLYYFGIDLPGLVGVIDANNGDVILYGDELSIDDIVWTGPLPSLQSLAELSGVSLVKPFSQVINSVSADLHFLPPYRADQTLMLSKLIGKKPHKIEKRASNRLIRAVVAQREIKSEEEIVEINKAVSITNEMHLAVMKFAKAGMKEHHLVSEAAKVAYDHNVHFSFTPIMTTQGQVLHNHSYHNTLEAGDMLLFDGGCESLSHYAGDITRTFPVSAQFDERQTALYNIVHHAQSRSVALCQVGTPFYEAHIETCRTIVEGFKEIGVMKGDVEEAIADGAHTMFFQCGLGHMMGLDVHDMENLGEPKVGYDSKIEKRTDFGFKSLRLGKELQEGFVITVEPGIYMIPELIDLRKSQKAHEAFINYPELEKWRNFGGIRLEDDFVIRSTGPELLGIEMPRSIEEIESVRAMNV